MIAITFVMTPIMLRYLGKVGYGVWLLINSLTGYLGLFDLGIQSSTTKYVAEYIGKKDNNELKKLVATTFLTFSIIACIVLLVSSLLAFFTNSLFKIPEGYQKIAPYLVLLVGAEISISFVFATFVQFFSGLQRYEVHAAIQTCSMLLKACIIYALLKSGHGLLSIALLTFIFGISERLVYMVLFRNLRLGLSVRPVYFDKTILQNLFHYSLRSFTISIATRLITYTDNIIIGAMVSVSDISVYGVAARLVEYMKELPIIAAYVLNPAASNANANDQKALRQLALYSAKYTAILIAPIASGFFIVGDSFIYLWLGDGFSKTYEILVVLTISNIFILPLSGIGAMLYGVGKHAILAKILGAEALGNLILSLVLVRYYGILGVALGTAIPSLFFNLFILPYKVTKIFNVGVREYYFSCLLKPFILALPFAVVLLVYKDTFGNDTWLHFFGGISAALIFYGLVIYQFELKKVLRDRYGSLSKQIGNFFRGKKDKKGGYECR